MTLLLDSHVLLWSAADDPTLPARIVTMIEDAPAVAVSLATPWELQIKAKAGKRDTAAIVWGELEDRGVALLLPTLDDVLLAADLPLHHRDPFDRLMIAQARRRGLAIVTRDRVFGDDGVPVVPA